MPLKIVFLGDGSFSFLGAGTPVFGSLADKKKKETPDKSKNQSADEETNEDNEEEYDPHYEPIVPLPDTIVVSTGEEEETPVFNERAKLYRFDVEAKEWKERGVGQLKILYHPENCEYIMLRYKIQKSFNKGFIVICLYNVQQHTLVNLNF